MKHGNPEDTILDKYKESRHVNKALSVLKSHGKKFIYMLKPSWRIKDQKNFGDKEMY